MSKLFDWQSLTHPENRRCWSHSPRKLQNIEHFILSSAQFNFKVSQNEEITRNAITDSDHISSSLHAISRLAGLEQALKIENVETKTDWEAVAGLEDIIDFGLKMVFISHEMCLIKFCTTLHGVFECRQKRTCNSKK